VSTRPRATATVTPTSADGRSPRSSPPDPAPRRIKGMHEAWEGFDVDRMWTDLHSMPE
jgi:hypothetical protein